MFNRSRRNQRASIPDYLYYNYPLSTQYLSFTGPTGCEGPMGPMGPANGPQGPQGPQGIQGPVGEQGPEGPVGEQGPEGPVGEQGVQGIQGIQGEVGPQGIQGEVGPQGIPGEVGPQGIPGEVGPQGIQGEVGPQGIQGEVGPQGSFDTTSDITFEGNVTIANPIKINYLPTQLTESSAGFQVLGTQLINESSVVTCPSTNTPSIHSYSSIILPVGVWLVESLIQTISSASKCSTMAYLSLSESSTEINNKQTTCITIPLDSGFTFYHKLSGIFTVSEPTTIYTLIGLFNAIDSVAVANDQPITLEPSPMISATRIA